MVAYLPSALRQATCTDDSGSKVQAERDFMASPGSSLGRSLGCCLGCSLDRRHDFAMAGGSDLARMLHGTWAFGNTRGKESSCSGSSMPS